MALTRGYMEKKTLCMDVAGGKIDENYTPIQAWECYGGANQEWTFEYFP